MPPDPKYLQALKEWGTQKQSALDFIEMYRTLSKGAEAMIKTAEQAIREEERATPKNTDRINIWKARLKAVRKDRKDYEKKIKSRVKVVIKLNKNKPQEPKGK
jgi:hypothetical protein